jgi:hypothetical protein
LASASAFSSPSSSSATIGCSSAFIATLWAGGDVGPTCQLSRKDCQVPQPRFHPSGECQFAFALQRLSKPRFDLADGGGWLRTGLSSTSETLSSRSRFPKAVVQRHGLAAARSRRPLRDVVWRAQRALRQRKLGWEDRWSLQCPTASRSCPRSPSPGRRSGTAGTSSFPLGCKRIGFGT